MLDDLFDQAASGGTTPPSSGGLNALFDKVAGPSSQAQAEDARHQADAANEKNVIEQGRFGGPIGSTVRAVRDFGRSFGNANATFNAGIKNFAQNTSDLASHFAGELERADTSEVDKNAPEENALRAARAKQTLMQMQQRDTAVDQGLAARPQPVNPLWVPAQVGQAAGTISNIAAAGPFALPAMQAEGFDTRRREMAARTDLTDDQKQAYLAGGYAADTFQGALLPSAGVTGRGVAGITTKLGLGIAEQNVGNVLQNYNAQQSGVDPDRNLGQGWQQATAMGAIPAIHAAVGELTPPATNPHLNFVSGEPTMERTNEHFTRQEPYKMGEQQGPEKPLANAEQPYDFAALRERVEEARNQPIAEQTQNPEAVAHNAEADAALKAGTFEAPGKAAPEDEAVQAAMEKRINERRQEQAEINPEDERRATEDRRTHDLIKQGTFQTPEEVAEPNVLKQIREAQPETPREPEPVPAQGPSFFQAKAGEHAVNEEYGKPPVEEAAKPAPAAEASAPENETFFQRMVREGKAKIVEKAQNLASEEEGGVKVEPFIRRDVKPAIGRVAEWAGKVGAAIDRHWETGFTNTDSGDKLRLGIREAMGKAEQAGHAFEAKIADTGAREVSPKFSEDRRSFLTNWNMWEDGASGKTAGEQKARELINSKRKENYDQAKKLGLNLKDAKEEDDLALSRVFVPDPHSPNYKPGKGTGSSSMAGSENFLKGQKFDKPSDAVEAAERKGLKPAYDTVEDMQLARQYEFERSMAAREQLRSADKNGQLEWVRKGTKPSDGNDTSLEDKIGTERRHMALREDIANQFNGVHPQKVPEWLQSREGAGEFVRPGEEPSPGNKFVPHYVEGTYHGPEDNTRAFNDMMNKGRGDPLAKLPSLIAGGLTGQRYAWGLAHGFMGSSMAIGKQIGTMIDPLVKGATFGKLGMGTDAARRWQSVRNLFTGEGFRKANAFAAHIESGGTENPQMKEAADRVMASNPKYHFQSVLNRPRFSEAAEELKQGNWQGATGRVIGETAKWAHDLVYHTVLQKLDMSARLDLAEQHIRQGVSKEAGAKEMAQAGDTIARDLGRHIETPAFKNDVMTIAGQVVAPAYKFNKSIAQNWVTEPFVKQNPHAIAGILGLVTATAVTSAATQMALSYWNTGKIIYPTQPRDYYNPRTGNQTSAGKAERIWWNTPLSKVMRVVGGTGDAIGGGSGSEATNEIAGVLNPAFRATKEVIQNKDFHGNQVRPEEGSGLGNLARGAGHILRNALPQTATSMLDNNPAGDERSVGTRIAQAVTGTRTGHPNTSKAMEIAEDVLDQNQPKGRNLKEQEMYQNKAKWSSAIREGQKPGATPDEKAAMEQARTEMQKAPAMSKSLTENIFTRASRKQGLASIVLDSKMTAPVLAKMWDAASDEEKETMRPGVMRRLSKAKPGSQTELAEWKALKGMVKP